MSLEFQHFHRIDKDSKIIRTLCEHIKNGDISKFVFDNEKYCFFLPINLMLNEKNEIYLKQYHSKFQEIKEKLTILWRTHNLTVFNHHVIVRHNALREQLNIHAKAFFNVNKNRPFAKFKKTIYPHSKISFSCNVSGKIEKNTLYVILRIEDRLQDRYCTEPDDKIQVYETVDVGDTEAEESRELKRFLTNNTKVIRRYIYVINLYEYKKSLSSCSDVMKNKHVVDVEWDFVKKHIHETFVSTIENFHGQEIENIIYILPYQTYFDSRNLIYTAVSRCINKIFIIAKREDLDFCVKNNIISRESLLKYLLQKVKETQVFKEINKIEYEDVIVEELKKTEVF